MLLELRGVTVRYENVEAVRGLSLKVAEGDFVTIIGANGAGKTSTFNAISGLVPAAMGEIWFDRQRIDGLSAPEVSQRRIIQVPEGRQIFPLLTVMENLKVGCYLQRDKKKIAAGLERVFSLFPDLKTRLQAKGARLSGGQQQMLAVGRALMADPRLLLMDEPSLGLSPLLVKHLAQRMRQINEEGITILLVEQNARMGLGLAGYGYVLENGELKLEGSSASLLADADVKRAYLGV